jgi:hypothetical protein
MSRLADHVRMPRTITTNSIRAKPSGTATEPCSIERLRKLIAYDPDTGRMIWLPRPWNPQWTAKFAGKPALTAQIHLDAPERGRQGTLFGVCVRAHRVAYALAHDRWPVVEVNARNGDLRDLRAVNLVQATTSFIRQRAAKKTRTNNTSGVPGVSLWRARGTWLASITVAGERHHLGRFKTFEDAVTARRAAEVAYGVSPKHIKELLNQRADA